MLLGSREGVAGSRRARVLASLHEKPDNINVQVRL